MALAQEMSSGYPRIDRRPLHCEVLERLREMIFEGRLAEGVRLNERLLCGELGISRTPLREALKVLAAEGLVELLPHRGAVVARIDPAQVAQTFEVMSALEGLAGRLACARADERALAGVRAAHYEMLACHARGDLPAYFRCNQAIHRAIVEAAANPVLAETYERLNARVRRARYAANLSPERWREAVREHEAMLQALLARDGDRLAALLASHLDAKLAALAARSPGAVDA